MFHAWQHNAIASPCSSIATLSKRIGYAVQMPYVSNPSPMTSPVVCTNTTRRLRCWLKCFSCD
jgi:hypothetical protein